MRCYYQTPCNIPSHLDLGRVKKHPINSPYNTHTHFWVETQHLMAKLLNIIYRNTTLKTFTHTQTNRIED